MDTRSNVFFYLVLFFLENLRQDGSQKVQLGGAFKYFSFHPYLGKWSNLTNIFQMGWNHQPAKFSGTKLPFEMWPKKLLPRRLWFWIRGFGTLHLKRPQVTTGVSHNLHDYKSPVFHPGKFTWNLNPMEVDTRWCSFSVGWFSSFQGCSNEPLRVSRWY